VAIPNAEFAQTQIENFGKRDMIRFLQVISVRYDTTPDQMRYLLLRLKEILTEHEMIDTDPVRVRFIKFGLNGLEIELCAYVHTAENEIFLAVKEDINLRILEVIAECGSYFSFPTSTINWERPAPRDPQKILEISRKLKELQERSE
jgi:MscS family membrane protein